MTIIHDMLCRPTAGELGLRKKLEAAQAHADALEEALMKPDPREFSDNAVHVAICFERQKAAHAHRKAGTLQSQLNGAENRRYSRGMACWLVMGFGAQYLQASGVKLENLAEIFKVLGAIL